MKFFVSYRLRQVDHVRPIVDFIRASGIPVWFNEYDILLNNNHLFDEDKVGQQGVKSHLASAVNEGCTHAAIFSNDEWANSGYCNAEAEAILDNIAQENIVQVHIPQEGEPHVKYPKLKNVKQLVYDNNIYEIAANIIKWLGRVPLPFEPYQHTGVINYPQAGLVIHPGVFTLEKEKTDILNNPNHILFSGMYTGTEVRLGITAYPYQPTIDGLSKTLVELELTNETGTELKKMQSRDYDIRLRNQYLEYLRGWATENKLNVLGLNVFFNNGRSHFAVTYETNETLERRFVLALKDNPLQSGEIHFIFYLMKSQFQSAEEAQAAFLKCCPVFDEFISNVKYDPALDISQVFPTGFTRVFYSIILLLALVNMDDFSGGRFLVPVFAGLIFGDLFTFYVSNKYKRYLSVFGMRGTFASEHDSPEEVWGEIFSNVMAYIPTLITNFVIDAYYSICGTRFGFSIPTIIPALIGMWWVQTKGDFAGATSLTTLVVSAAVSQIWLIVHLTKRMFR